MDLCLEGVDFHSDGVDRERREAKLSRREWIFTWRELKLRGREWICAQR